MLLDLFRKDATTLLAKRVRCPCCDYPTLGSRAEFDICELCNWEDDGQSDDDADEVRGGPNGGYSLTEARLNFAKYRVMYAPERDRRIGGPDSSLVVETKERLIAAFNMLAAGAADRKSLCQEIVRLEKALEQELVRKIREYEAKLR